MSFLPKISIFEKKSPSGYISPVKETLLLGEFLGWFNFYPLLCEVILQLLDDTYVELDFWLILWQYPYDTWLIPSFQPKNKFNFQNKIGNLAISLSSLYTSCWISPIIE
jgi:hypothetical protein